MLQDFFYHLRTIYLATIRTSPPQRSQFDTSILNTRFSRAAQPEIDRTPWPASEGNQSMDLNGTMSSSIEQTIDRFTKCASYELLIDYGLQAFATIGATAQVLIDDQLEVERDDRKKGIE